ncbi:ankyrin repeat-containing domain protein [Mycena polygramma]|nr:ankyrin repeat-containing domain protein [Mycena polygramma]
MPDPLSIAGAIVAFCELAMTIKESIEKVGENQENLADLEKEVQDTVKELKSLAQGHGDMASTGELLTALTNLTEQLETIEFHCQSLTQSKLKKIPAFVKAWFKRDKIEAEIKKLKENRTKCCTQFQLLSLARLGQHAARNEVTAAKTEGNTVRIEANTKQLITLTRKKELRDWFQPLDMREKQRATQALRHKDTGSWVLEGTEFREWKEQPGCLCIRGISGTGKSVLSSIVIDNLFKHRVKVRNSCPDPPNLAVAYFYFDFGDEKKQLLQNMLRSIIMQLSAQSPTPYSVLDQHFESCQGEVFPTYDDLLVMLATILSECTRTYIVLDALDECSEPDALIQFFCTLRGWAKPVHLFVASQPHKIFVESLVFEEATVIVLEPVTTHADILQFVHSKLRLKELKHVQKAEDAASKIVNKSNGMFRMAECLLRELARTRVDPDLDAILARLPTDLFGIYGRFLEHISADDFVYVTRLLRWLAFSARPVTLRELEDALAIHFSDPNHGVFEQKNRGRLVVVCDLLEGLVAVGLASSTSRRHQDLPQTTGSVVALAHSSVADYIVSEHFLEEYKHDLREAPSHTFLTQSCVAYLLHFKNNPLNSTTLPHYPLALYAAKFWSHHLFQCHDRGVLQCSTMHLLEPGSQQYIALDCLYSVELGQEPDWFGWCTPSPLHLCSMIGYIEGAQFLLENGVTPKARRRERGSSALQAACLKGHAKIVKLLIENGADTDAIEKKERTNALRTASKNGRVETVQLLLDYGAKVNLVDGMESSALEAACWAHHAEVVQLLLDHGADVNTTGIWSALQGAARCGVVDIVRLLLKHGAGVNKMAESGSMVRSAAENGHVHTVRILFEHGADINAVATDGWTALQGAARNGHADTVRFLLEHNADANAVGGDFGSALQGAARSGHVDTVRILLEHGAVLNAVGRQSNALQYAARNGHMDTVRLLLEHGANVNAADAEGVSALQRAVRCSNRDVVRILLEYGADVHTVRGEFGYALQNAMFSGNVDIFRSLLDYGADLNVVGPLYHHLLQSPWKYDLNIFHILLDHGADVGHAVRSATRNGQVDTVRFLLEHGARANAIGGEFGSALQSAAWNGHVEIVRILLEHGADVHATGGAFGSALEAASAGGHKEIVQMLREHGAHEGESSVE